MPFPEILFPTVKIRKTKTMFKTLENHLHIMYKTRYNGKFSRV